MLARIFVLIGSVVVLLLTVALVGPYFIDWTSYRSDFEREASRILGRDVTVSGAAKARLLPFPSIAFTGIEVASRRPGEPWLSIDSFSMDMELAPLLRGELLIVDMRIERPRAMLDVGEDGRIDWTLNPEIRLDPRQVAAERITLVDGEIGLRLAASGREHHLTGIEAQLSAKMLSGPWHLAATFGFDGRRLSLSGSTGSIQPDGSISLRLQARPEAAPFTLETEGTLRLAKSLGYSGTFRLASRAAERMSEPFSISVEEPDAAPTLEARIAGDFELDHLRLEIPEFRLESGPPDDPYLAFGSAYLDHGFEPHFTIRLEGQQMRLDADRPGRQAAMPFQRRLSALQVAIAALPHPAIPGTVEVRLPAIVAGDTTIRQLDLAAEPVAEGWRIRRFSAQLPGRSTLEADGTLAVGDEAEFHGNLLLAVAQPSGFAAWLSEDVDDAIRRIGAAGLQAKVTLSQRRQSLRELELVLGNARFGGEIDHHVPRDARPSMLLRLKGGALDLDGLLAFGALFVDRSGATRLTDHDLDFEVEAGPVQAGGITAAHVDTALRLKEGRLEIDRLSVADLAGATISATGHLHGIPDRPGGMLDAAILASDLAPLARWLAERGLSGGQAQWLEERLAIDPDLLADASINLVASAASNVDGSVGLALSANGLAGGGGFTVTGSATRRGDAFEGPVSLTASLRNDDPARLLAALGLPALSLGFEDHAEIVFSLRGDPEESLRVEASLRGEYLRAGLSGNAVRSGGRMILEGRADLAAGDIEPWLASGGLSLPGAGWGMPVELAAKLEHDGRRLKLEGIEGSISGSAVAGKLVLEPGSERPRIVGDLKVEALDLEPVLAMIAGNGSVPMAGEGWTVRPFTAQPRLPLVGQLDVEAASLGLGNGVGVEDARMKLALEDGGLRIHAATAMLQSGRLEGDFEFRNDAGTGFFSAQFQLAGYPLAHAGDGFGVEGKADLSASLTASGRSFEAMINALAGSGSASAGELQIHGLNPDAFAAIIGLAGAGDREPEAVAELALGPIRGGSFPVRDLKLAFTVASGVARTPTLRLQHPGATLEADLDLHLPTRAVRGNALLAYAAGRDELVGAEPAVQIAIGGTASSPEVEFDSAPLARYLTRRALEIEQARVEAAEERLLERQRLRREVRYYSARLSQAETGQSGAPAPSGPPAGTGSLAGDASALPEEAGWIQFPAAEDLPEDLPGPEPAVPDLPQSGAGDIDVTLPELTDIIPVARENAAPMRLVPLPEPQPAPAAAVPPRPGVVGRRPAEPRPQQRSLFDLLIQQR